MLAFGVLPSIVQAGTTVATPEQTAAIATAVGIPSTCGRASQSEVDPAWFMWNTIPNGCTEDSTSTAALHERSPGIFEIVVDLTADDEPSACADVGIEADVGSDFNWAVCIAKRQAVLYVWHRDEMQERPKTLAWGAHAGIHGLRWRGWGRRTSTALGTLRYSDAYLPRTQYVPVRVTVGDRSACGSDEQWFYRRVTVQLRRKKDRAKWSAIPGSNRFRCSDFGY